MSPLYGTIISTINTISSLAFSVHFLGGILYVLCKVMYWILLGDNLSDLKSNFCWSLTLFHYIRLFTMTQSPPPLLLSLLNNYQWSVLYQSSIIIRTYSSIIFAIINCTNTLVAMISILTSAHQKLLGIVTTSSLPHLWSLWAIWYIHTWYPSIDMS